jgi:excisionase family DNA binding protein
MRRQTRHITSRADKITAGDMRAASARVLSRARRIGEQRTFSPLIDAKAAGRLLGVPHTWLLAQARAGRIPHHRLGHYVRFYAEDFQEWLRETRSGPPLESSTRRHER